LIVWRKATKKEGLALPMWQDNGLAKLVGLYLRHMAIE